MEDETTTISDLALIRIIGATRDLEVMIEIIRTTSMILTMDLRRLESHQLNHNGVGGIDGGIDISKRDLRESKKKTTATNAHLQMIRMVRKTMVNQNLHRKRPILGSLGPWQKTLAVEATSTKASC